MSQLNRRQLLTSTLATATAATVGKWTVVEAAQPAGSTDYAAIHAPLDAFVQRYMKEMNSPGMTLVLADRDGVQRVVAYGMGDLERREPVRSDELFQIGSISKSFIAICLLQLHEEGKLDLHKPVADYLPWFRVESRFAPITTHHLLTHGSGLPGTPNFFLSDPAARHQAAHAPGEYFHYNNMAFEVLGMLAWTLDGRALPELLRQRILLPLGMSQTEPVITIDMRERLVRSYSSFRNDRPTRRSGRLCEAPATIETNGAGCIASTARDMGAYVTMIANRGAGPKGRLLSKESFELFSRSHIRAEEFGSTAGYGYGIAVDTLDGHAVVRHTGGMLSFMSALLVDVEAGMGAFASINAMQDYRPTQIVQYATQLMRARRTGKDPTEVHVPESAVRVQNPQAFVGVYTQPSGRRLSVVAEGDALYLQTDGNRIALESTGESDRFLVAHPDFDRFLLIFGRRNPRDPNSAVTEVAWGSEWYAGAAYEGPREFTTPREWDSYIGHYRNENPWVGSTRILARKGRLWMDGVIPLEAHGERFYLRDEEHSPEWVSFADPVNGRCMRLKFSGQDLWRVETA